MKSKNIILTSPLAGGARRTDKSEGYIKEKSCFTPSLVCSDFVRQTTSPAKGGSQTTGGFTLIELLVVVLIIGILAAVALPQYQKAVDKTRYTQAMTLAEKIWQSEQRYKLANGNYTYTFDELDLDMPTPKSTSNDGESDNYFYHWGSCWIHTNGYTTCKVKLGSDYAWYFARHTSSARQCWAQPQNSKRANTLCQTLTKSHTGTDNGTLYKTYTFPN